MSKHAQSLLDELKLGHLSEEENKQMLAQLAETLQNRIMVRVMDILSDEDKKNLDHYIGKKDIDSLNQYLAENVQGFETLAQDEYQKLRQELLSENAEIMAAIKAVDKK